MSNFTNPFATIGDYRGNAASLADPDEVTLSYLTGLPNVRRLTDPHMTMIFKNLLKRDAMTRERALKDFTELLVPGYTVDDETHLAFIQIYAKLSIDVLPIIRHKSHVALKALYLSLGRRSAKHLQSSVGPWLAATHDPDPAVSGAAEDAWNAVFPDKKQLVIAKMREAIIEFVAHVLTTLSPTNISDMRYLSNDDANEKYFRVVKTAVDTVNFDLSFDDDSEQPKFLMDDSIWKFLASKNAYLMKSVLIFGNSKLADFQPVQVAALWKHLLKGLRACPPAVSVELLKTVSSVTEKHASVWTQSESIASLAQFILNAGNSPRQVWPLLFKLIVQQLPESVNLHEDSTASLILKSTKKALSEIVGDAESSAWGCYLALCTKPGKLKYVQQAVEAAAKRCTKHMLPPLFNALVSRFNDLVKVEGIKDTIATAMVGNAGFVKVIASTGSFENEIESVLPTLPLKSVTQIIAMKPDLKLDTSEWQPGPELLEVAIHSTTVDRQAIVNRLIPEFAGLVLDKASKLTDTHGDFSEYVDENNASSLRAAILAHGSLVPEDKAKGYFSRLCELVDQQDDALSELSKAVSEDEAFCVPLLLENTSFVSYLQDSDSNNAAKILSKLNSKDTLEQLLKDLNKDLDISDVGVLVDRGVKLSVDLESTKKALLCDVDWLKSSALYIKSTSQWIYEVDCWHLAEFEPESDWVSTFARALYLLEVHEQVGDRLDAESRSDLLVKLFLVGAASFGHVFIDQRSNLTENYNWYLSYFEKRGFADPYVEEKIWKLTEGKSAIAFHATQICSHFMAEGRLIELAEKSRESFVSPSLRGALIAQNSAVSEQPWYDRYQSELVNDLNLLTIPMADMSVVSERLQDKLLEKIMESEGALFVEELKLLHQLEYYPDAALVRRALERDLESQFAILQMIDPGDYADDVALAASRLQPESSRFDSRVHSVFLEHAKGALTEHVNVPLRALFNLMVMDSEILPWVAYGYLHEYVVSSYREKLLSSNLEDTALSPHIQRILRDKSQHKNEIVWLLLMSLVETYVDVSTQIDRKSRSAMSLFGEWDEIYENIFDFIAEQLMNATREDLVELKAEELILKDDLSLAVHLLYSLSLSLSSLVRTWYREVRDRRLLKSIEDALQFAVGPAILRSVGANTREIRKTGKLEGTSVSEKLREFRAQVDFDDHIADVVIRLPSLYPAKSATVEIKNLGGVPEAKRRAWVLEAEFSVQNGAIIGAMKGLLLRLNNFLEGVEPCAICYQLVLNGKQLPNKPCSTCHNTYHADCLFKWFNSNKTKLCPMCRSSF